MNDPHRPLGWYRKMAFGTRAHVALRWATCPFGDIEAELPAEGAILDWGCGHGVLATWAAHRSAGRTAHGVDIDADKLEIARSAAVAAHLADRTSFALVDPDEVPDGSWPAVVVNDVLYLLTPDAQVRLVEAAAAVIAPGGVLVAKVMGDGPRWKVRATEAQEAMVVGRLGVTASDAGVHPSPSIDDVMSWMVNAGLSATARPVDRGYHCPHVLVIGRRPG